MKYFWIKTFFGFLVVVALSVNYYLQSGHTWIFALAVIIELVEIPLYTTMKRKNIRLKGYKRYVINVYSLFYFP